MSMKIIDYSLIESDQHDELVEAVCAAMTEGWQPLGGVCVWFEPVRVTATNEQNFVETAGGIVRYVQALVKYGD